jgi:hypothetical protein
MPLTYETTRKQYKVGQDPATVHAKVYSYTAAQMSKDIVRELARSAGMVGYSNRSQAEMLDYLNGLEDLPIHHVDLKVVRKL